MDRPADVGGCRPLARPAPPLAWIAADGDDAAVVVAGQEIPMKPGARGYATQLWAQRRGFTLPADVAAASRGVYDCDRRGAFRGRDAAGDGGFLDAQAPGAGRYADLCAGADIVILRSAFAPAEGCGRALVLTRADFERAGRRRCSPTRPAGGWPGPSPCAAIDRGRAAKARPQDWELVFG